MAVIRLRITPAAELSGLGVADTDGGIFYVQIQKAINSPIKDYIKSQQDKSKIESEVQELSRIVSGQDVLLQTLVTRQQQQAPHVHNIRLDSQAASPSAGLPPLTNGQRMPVNEQMESVLRAALEHLSVQAPVVSTQPLATARSASTGTGSSVEDYSNHNGSAGAVTPPMNAPANVVHDRGADTAARNAALHALAAHLAQVMQNQGQPRAADNRFELDSQSTDTISRV